MKSHSSSSFSADLHDFKMNLTKTLNSNYMLTFNEKRRTSFRFKQKQPKRPPKASSIPCIPVKVIPSYYMNKNNETDLTNSDDDDDDDDDESEDEISSNASVLVKSKFNSPFLFRKSLVLNDSSNEIHSCVSSEENLSNMSSLVSTSISGKSDSGVSSMNSADLFIADLKECLSEKRQAMPRHRTATRNQTRYDLSQLINADEYGYLIIQFMNKFGYRSLIK